MKLLKALAILLVLTAGSTRAELPKSETEASAHNDVREYVRIRCLYGDRFLYQRAGSDMVHFSTDIDAADQRAHWYLEGVPDGEGQWIRNRTTGDGMHIEGRVGFIEVGPLQTTFHSYRWNLEPVEDFYLIQNVWQKEQYICLEDTEVDMAGHELRNDSWWSLRFKLDPVSP